MKPAETGQAKEQFKEFRYSGFYISNLGNWFSKRDIPVFEHKSGYLVTNLKGRRFKIHRIVTECFFGLCPKTKVVNHIDGNKLNNRIDNLEYITPSENTKHAYRIGLISTLRPRKLSTDEVSEIRQIASMYGFSERRAAKEYMISGTAIRKILQQTTYKNV